MLAMSDCDLIAPNFFELCASANPPLRNIGTSADGRISAAYDWSAVKCRSLSLLCLYERVKTRFRSGHIEFMKSVDGLKNCSFSLLLRTYLLKILLWDNYWLIKSILWSLCCVFSTWWLRPAPARCRWTICFIIYSRWFFRRLVQRVRRKLRLPNILRSHSLRIFSLNNNILRRKIWTAAVSVVLVLLFQLLITFIKSNWLFCILF